MKRLLLIAGLLAMTLTTQATDLTLLTGYQFNTDFEISTLDHFPPILPPLTGEPGDSVALEEGSSFGLAMDFVFKNNPDQRIGFFISRQQTDFESNAGLLDASMDVTHVHFTGMNYYPRGKMEYFVLLGIGVGFYSPGDKTLDDETRLSAQIGAGANYKFSNSLLLRMDIRWLPTFFNVGGAAFCDGGCTIKLSSNVYNQVQVNIGLMYRY